MCASHTICQHPIEYIEEHVHCLYIGPGIISSLVTPLDGDPDLMFVGCHDQHQLAVNGDPDVTFVGCHDHVFHYKAKNQICMHCYVFLSYICMNRQWHHVHLHMYDVITYHYYTLNNSG